MPGFSRHRLCVLSTFIDPTGLRTRAENPLYPLYLTASLLSLAHHSPYLVLPALHLRLQGTLLFENGMKLLLESVLITWLEEICRLSGHLFALLQQPFHLIEPFLIQWSLQKGQQVHA